MKIWTHAELVARGARWLRNSYDCPVVLTETATYSGEIPDVIGWKRNGRSVMIECKSNRSDFLADAIKPHRKAPEIALGAERWYMIPAGEDIIRLASDDLPSDWGLIEVKGNRCKIIVQARPRKDLRSDIAKSCEMRLLVASLHRVQCRLGNANLHDWLRWDNRFLSAEYMSETAQEKEDLYYDATPSTGC